MDLAYATLTVKRCFTFDTRPLYLMVPFVHTFTLQFHEAAIAKESMSA